MARTVRIATFNLESLDDRPGEAPPLDERIRVLRPQLLRLEADVLCLQEVNAQHADDDPKGPRRLLALDRLLAGTPYEGFERAASGARGGDEPADVHNLVTLSRFPIAERRQHWHDLVPAPTWRAVTAEPAAREPAPVEWDRPLLHVQVRVDEDGGRPLHVVNLHLRSPLAAVVPGQKLDSFAWKSVPGWAEGFWLAAIKRAGQALEARVLIDHLFDQDAEALIAVAGDFNATARETPCRMIRGDEEDTGSGRLAGRALVPVERSIPDSRRYSVLHHGEPVMLDHVFVSRALMAWYRDVEAHNEALEDELVAFATVSRSPVSFHAPLVAEFELP